MKKVILIFAITVFIGCDKKASTNTSEKNQENTSDTIDAPYAAPGIKVELPESKIPPSLSNACTIEMTKDDSLYISWSGHEREAIQWDDLETKITAYKKDVEERAICSVKCDDDVTVGSLKKILSTASKLEIKAILNITD